MASGALAKLPDDEVLRMLATLGPTKMAKVIGCSTRAIQNRRLAIESRTGQKLVIKDTRKRDVPLSEVPGRLLFEVENGVVLIGSDAHFWPDRISTAHRAFVKFCKELKPKIVVMNGDMVDGASISRHPPIGWEDRPSVIQEIETTQDRLDEIARAAGKAVKVWPLGNHDARFESRLAAVAPEYANVAGIHLKDHFPMWQGCWSAWINDDVVVKHRFKGGIHATHNNTMWAGKTIVTGHLHSLKVTPLTDYNGTRWGVDTGTMADPFGPQFNDYCEDSPRNWRSGFIVLTFHKSRLLWPEVVHVIGEGEIEFQGRVFSV